MIKDITMSSIMTDGNDEIKNINSKCASRNLFHSSVMQTSVSLPTACNLLFLKLVELLRDKANRQRSLTIISTITPFIKLHIDRMIQYKAENDSITDILIYYFRSPFIQLQSLSNSDSEDNIFMIQLFFVSFDMMKSFSELLNVL